MKRVMSLLLVLVLCLTVPFTAFATQSPGQDGTAPVGPDDVPKTGDTAQLGMWLIIMLIALLALVLVCLYFRKVSKQ